MFAVSNRFLLVAIVAGLSGMVMGLGMAMGQDFTLAPAHAHLNLLGWVAMFLYGLFYRSVPEAARGVLPQVHFWLATLGLAVMIPALALVLSGNTAAEPVVGLGALLVMLALLVFAAVVIRAARTPQRLAGPDMLTTGAAD